MTETAKKTIADLIEDRFGLPSEAGRDMPAEGELARILARRTHRRYTDQPIPDETLQVLLACAFSASAKSDLQQASVVIVKDRAKRDAIQALIPDMPWIGQAPVFMVFCGDNRRIRRACQLRGKPFGNDNLDSFMNAAVDTGLVMQTFILSAEAMGLGCCPISVVRNHIEKVSALLDLPDWVFPLAGLCVGWPAQRGFISMRLPQSLTVHVDRYDDSRFAEELDGYDRRRDARFSIPAEKQRRVDAFGQADFYGWSEDKARQVSEPERQQLRPFLQKRGFALT